MSILLLFLHAYITDLPKGSKKKIKDIVLDENKMSELREEYGALDDKDLDDLKTDADVARQEKKEAPVNESTRAILKEFTSTFSTNENEVSEPAFSAVSQCDLCGFSFRACIGGRGAKLFSSLSRGPTFIFKRAACSRRTRRKGGWRRNAECLSKGWR